MYIRTSLRRSGSIAIVHGDLLELVQHVRPCLEQLYPLWPVGRTIVCASDIVLVLVRKRGSITSGLNPRSLRIVPAAERKPWGIISSFVYPIRRSAAIIAPSDSGFFADRIEGSTRSLPSDSGQISRRMARACFESGTS